MNIEFCYWWFADSWYEIFRVRLYYCAKIKFQVPIYNEVLVFGVDVDFIQH